MSTDRRKILITSRWIAIAIFSLSSSINFLDRQLLAAVAPTIRQEFNLNNAQYGEIIAAFSLAYAFATPVFGLLLDRIGLLRGSGLVVGLWSLASAATTFVSGVRGLVLCRMGLGVGESAGIPMVSKASASYLPPEELGLATAAGSIAVMIGTVTAPLLAATMGTRYGWRSVFLFSGALGLPWLLLLRFVSRQGPQRNAEELVGLKRSTRLMADPQLWGIAVVYALVMVEYSLWLNWTTTYFVEARHLTTAEANRYFAWIPPLFGTLGSFVGGSLAYFWIRRGTEAKRARLRVYLFSIPLLLMSALVPWLPTSALAAVGIGLGVAGCMSIMTAVHALPIDLFGTRHAAFSVSLLASSYALTQAFVSPMIGGIIDRVGFTVLCAVMPTLPVAGFLIARATLRRSAGSSSSRSDCRLS